ncbi:MAG: hypothetical protein QOJ44_731, partial [Acidimicrobiaceae bacterium]|nr:hypothetical protein [Acidimicrobiaceae bacterium]
MADSAHQVIRLELTRAEDMFEV